MTFNLNLSYRDLEEWLLASDAVCRVLELSRIPDHTTFFRTFKKLRQMDFERLKRHLLDPLGVDEAAPSVDSTGFTSTQASAYFQACRGRTIREYVRGAYAVSTDAVDRGMVCW